jgi:hypothetical protein
VGDVRWERVVGDGCAYSGECLLVDVIVFPDSDGDYADLYDGRDATSGRKFCRIECAASTTRHWHFGHGVPFHVGIYVDGKDSAVETTVAFIPL